MFDEGAFVGVARTLMKRRYYHCLVAIIYFQINWLTTLHLCFNCLHLHFEHLAFPMTTHNFHFIMCLLCWWFVNSISSNIHILGMQRTLHSPLPLKGFNKIIILLVELKRQMILFLFFKHQILEIGMISCAFMIICKFLVVRVKWIPLIFAHDVIFWCFVFHFLL